jgi:hypothetical protein
MSTEVAPSSALPETAPAPLCKDAVVLDENQPQNDSPSGKRAIPQDEALDADDVEQQEDSPEKKQKVDSAPQSQVEDAEVPAEPEVPAAE